MESFQIPQTTVLIDSRVLVVALPAFVQDAHPGYSLDIHLYSLPDIAHLFVGLGLVLVFPGRFFPSHAFPANDPIKTDIMPRVALLSQFKPEF